MLKHPRKLRIERDQDLHRTVEEVAADVAADGVAREIVREGESLAVVVSKQIWRCGTAAITKASQASNSTGATDLT